MLFVAAVVPASYAFVLIPLPETLDCNKVAAVYKLFLGTKNSSLSLEIILNIYVIIYLMLILTETIMPCSQQLAVLTLTLSTYSIKYLLNGLIN